MFLWPDLLLCSKRCKYIEYTRLLARLEYRLRLTSNIYIYSLLQSDLYYLGVWNKIHDCNWLNIPVLLHNDLIGKGMLLISIVYKWLISKASMVFHPGLSLSHDEISCYLNRGIEYLNLFTTIHDGHFRRHSSMNVTIKWHKFSSNIYYIYVFFVIWSWKLR